MHVECGERTAKGEVVINFLGVRDLDVCIFIAPIKQKIGKIKIIKIEEFKIFLTSCTGVDQKEKEKNRRVTGRGGGGGYFDKHF